MKNVRLFELLDNIDDKYIVDAQIKPAPVAVFASENPFFNFFKNAVSVAAIFLVIGVIFVWTLVGKEILNAYHGSDTISEVTTTEPQTTPNKPQISVFRTENISRITFYPQNGYGEAYEVPSKYMTEITNWLKTFTIDKKLEDDLLPPGTNSVYVKIEYSDGAVIRNGLSLISIDGIRYYMKHDIEPECYWEILSQTPPDPSTTTDNGIIPSIPSTDTTTKPWHTTVPITATTPITIDPLDPIPSPE